MAPKETRYHQVGIYCNKASLQIDTKTKNNNQTTKQHAQKILTVI